jgi:hypothetical protein
MNLGPRWRALGSIYPSCGVGEVVLMPCIASTSASSLLLSDLSAEEAFAALGRGASRTPLSLRALGTNMVYYYDTMKSVVVGVVERVVRASYLLEDASTSTGPRHCAEVPR